MSAAKTEDRFDSWPVFLFILLALCFIGKVVLLYFTIDRGFDIGDEGDLLLMYRNYHFYSYNFFSKLSHSFFIRDLNPIYQYRVYKYLCDFYSCAFLAFSLSIWFHRSFSIHNPFSKVYLVAGSILFSLLGLGLSPYSPTQSYNDLTNVFMSSIIGLLLILLSMPKDTVIYVEIAICFVMGVILYFQTAVKMEISMILAAILIFILSLFPERKLLLRLGYMISILAGFGFVIIAFDPNPYQPVTADLKKEASYSIISILYLYISRDFYHLAFLAITVLCLYLRSLFKEEIYFFLILAIALPMMLGYYFYRVDLYNLQIDFQLCILASLLFLWYDQMRKADPAESPFKLSLKTEFLFFLIIMFPAILIAGTNSPLTEAFPLVSFPWFSLAGIIISWLWHSRPMRNYVLILSLCLMASSSYQFINNRILHPFMLKQNIFKSYITNPYLYNIKTDSVTIAFCGQMKELVGKNGFVPGDTIVTMGFTSGIAYMLEASMELTAFYLPDGWGDHYNCYCLSQLHRLPKFVILPTDQILKFDSCSQGHTKAQYDYLDSIFNPYANSYYKNRDMYLHVYKSKN